MQFKKAERRLVQPKIAITGPSGSGKTYSALRFAKGLGGKVAVIDTENGSASLYSDIFDFDTLCLEPPFTPDKYVQAIEAAEQAGYDVIVIDSLSHAWAGEGGTLDKKAALDVRGGNQFTNWKAPKQDFTKLKNAFLQSRAFVVCTIRSKQGYVLPEEGKAKPQKVGLDPIIEPSLEYEFTTVFDCAMDHNAQTSKDRTGIFDNKVERITEETAKKIITWLSGAKPAEPKTQSNVYVIPFGSLKGKTFDEVEKDALSGFYLNLQNHVANLKKTNKPVSPEVSDFLERAQPLVDLTPDFNSDAAL